MNLADPADRDKALDALIGDAADKVADAMDELVTVGWPSEEATWPPTSVNGDGKVTVAANSLGMAVNLSVMQREHGPGRTLRAKPVTQLAGFDAETARHIARQLVAAATWVEAKQAKKR